MTIAHDVDDRSSVVTIESFLIAACKLRVQAALRITSTAIALSLEVLLKPTVSLRRAQNRPYLDRNAYSGQYAKIAVHTARDFDFSGLEAIQTNVCIGRWEWCRYNAPPKEKGGHSIVLSRRYIGIQGCDTETPKLEKNC
ncbi:hypothetical protein [Pseudomonas sp. Leaf48]|uniref:hypothetical protein n=1 Tax=Pseudomonas sp. Leaf48 TaxID=1736221 RepID=UPI0012E7C711|nr:hypothetical protein [Pseudomonas sp. Leaf48]